MSGIVICSYVIADHSTTRLIGLSSLTPGTSTVHAVQEISPVTFNPDGAIAIIRIPNEQQFFMTNTFSF